MVRYIIFDFDGTLADTFAVIKELAMNLDESKKKDVCFEDITNMSIKEMFRKYETPLWKLPRFVKVVKKQLRERIETDVKTFKGLSRVLDKLSNYYSLGILSSNSRENIEKFLKRNNLDNFFRIIYSDSSIFGKAVKLRKLCRKHKISRGEIIYVGDEVRDIRACRKADIPVIAVSWGYNSEEFLRKEKPDYLASSPRELGRILMNG